MRFYIKIIISNKLLFLYEVNLHKLYNLNYLIISNLIINCQLVFIG